MSESAAFLITSEYRRFAEFCDACRQYRYIGLCYGLPGVGKTLSVRHYAEWEKFEAMPTVYRATDEQLSALQHQETVLFTPEVTTNPTAGRGVTGLCLTLRQVREASKRRAETVERHEKARIEDERRRERLITEDWFARKPPPAADEDDAPRYGPNDPMPKQPPLSPVTLILIDEADRLRLTGLEQMRDLFDRSGVGLIFIGMPGIEKRLARYPQLYSRIGFVHSFRPLRPEEIRQLLVGVSNPVGLRLPPGGVTEEDAVAAIIRITGGNFRLLVRLLAQTERIMRINGVPTVTRAVVEAARETLVIGSSQ